MSSPQDVPHKEAEAACIHQKWCMEQWFCLWMLAVKTLVFQTDLLKGNRLKVIWDEAWGKTSNTLTRLLALTHLSLPDVLRLGAPASDLEWLVSHVCPTSHSHTHARVYTHTHIHTLTHTHVHRSLLAQLCLAPVLSPVPRFSHTQAQLSSIGNILL